MEIILLSGMILALLAIFTVDTLQKRRKYLDEGK
jgi:hypothetical protein